DNNCTASVGTQGQNSSASQSGSLLQTTIVEGGISKRITNDEQKKSKKKKTTKTRQIRTSFDQQDILKVNGVLIDQLDNSKPDTIVSIYHSFFETISDILKRCVYKHRLVKDRKWGGKFSYQYFTAPWMKRTLSINNEVVYLNPNAILSVPDKRALRSNEGSRKAKYILGAFFDNEPCLRDILRKVVYEKTSISIKHDPSSVSTDILRIPDALQSTSTPCTNNVQNEEVHEDRQTQHSNGTNLHPIAPVLSSSKQSDREGVTGRQVLDRSTSNGSSGSTIPSTGLEETPEAVEVNLPVQEELLNQLTRPLLNPVPSAVIDEDSNPFLKYENENTKELITISSDAIEAAQKVLQGGNSSSDKDISDKENRKEIDQNGSNISLSTPSPKLSCLKGSPKSSPSSNEKSSDNITVEKDDQKENSVQRAKDDGVLENKKKVSQKGNEKSELTGTKSCDFSRFNSTVIRRNSDVNSALTTPYIDSVAITESREGERDVEEENEVEIVLDSSSKKKSEVEDSHDDPAVPPHIAKRETRLRLRREREERLMAARAIGNHVGRVTRSKKNANMSQAKGAFVTAGTSRQVLGKRKRISEQKKVSFKDDAGRKSKQQSEGRTNNGTSRMSLRHMTTMEACRANMPKEGHSSSSRISCCAKRYCLLPEGPSQLSHNLKITCHFCKKKGHESCMTYFEKYTQRICITCCFIKKVFFIKPRMYSHISEDSMQDQVLTLSFKD
ncbi:MAG: hypothetical protein AAF391_06930, partial [Bacteroidota bacterium]